jgi:hypothetical protein
MISITIDFNAPHNASFLLVVSSHAMKGVASTVRILGKLPGMVVLS